MLSDPSYEVPWNPAAEDDPLLFIAEVNVPIVFNTLGDAIVDRRRWAIGGSILPSFKARMLTTDSNPVSTPSFQPSFWVDGYYVSYPSRDYFGTSWRNPILHSLHAAIGLEHHSNGQEVCPFLADPDAPRYHSSDGDNCDGQNNDWTDNNVNYRTGEFSSTALMGRLDAEYNMIEGETGEERLGLVAGQLYRIELPESATGALEDEHRKLYGLYSITTRLAFWSQYTPLPWLAGRITGEITVAHFVSKSVDDLKAPPKHYAMEGRWTLDEAAGGGVYVRWENGRDPYNIRYLSNLNVLHWGLVFEHRSKIYRPKFAPPPPETD